MLEDIKISQISLDLIETDELQPRKKFDEEAIKSLELSIKEHGVLQPILVKSHKLKYKIIAGERRFRASKACNLKYIPAIIMNISEFDCKKIAIIENVQREQLSPLEEAMAYKTLIEQYNMTQQELATSIGKSRPYITNILRILNLDSKLKVLIENGDITVGHAKALLSLDDIESRHQVANKVIEECLSVRQTEKLAKDLSKKRKNSDLEIKEVELKLQELLGTKINIKNGRKKGIIEIEFYGEDHLSGILDAIIKE